MGSINCRVTKYERSRRSSQYHWLSNAPFPKGQSLLKV
ncbi:hypothetical protein AVDCRST_MAG94-4622 [uncultured Leptolyngbya sp.]|uniref:Uncharacterized protein n=1 Tax=uncultured Leptolyngbya sp. TaxID=332963 RepID=A0A6J4N4C4_9CYAN|nr:hypothetical protein AVDCRST_MAG94-4622 [uncultured Leptolyngbya sp.]